MNILVALIRKLNFKKIAIWYLICCMIAAAVSIGFVGYTFRDQIGLAISYKWIEEKLERGNAADTQKMKDSLSSLAFKSREVIDLLILDKNNKIVFTAKNSELSSCKTMTLVPHQISGYFTLTEKPDIRFRLVSKEELILPGIFHGHEKAEQERNDSLFFEPAYQQKSVYGLNYIANKQTGEKIYLIINSEVVPNGMLSIKIAGSAAAMFFMVYWVLIALWVYKNAGEAKLNAVLWGLITLLTNIAGLFAFLIYRQNGNSCPACGTLQNKKNSYCVFCGTKILDHCEHCGNAIHQRDRFCSGCGKRIHQTDDRSI